MNNEGILLVRKNIDDRIRDYARQKELMSKCKETYVMNDTEVISLDTFIILFLKAKTTLFDLINQDDKRISGIDCLLIGCNLALAIENCYENKICRLSMVPDNIFLDNYNRVLLHCFQPSIQVDEKSTTNHLNEKNLPPYEYFSRKYYQSFDSIDASKKEDQKVLIDILFLLFEKKSR